jgi:hypothetical protein
MVLLGLADLPGRRWVRNNTTRAVKEQLLREDRRILLHHDFVLQRVPSERNSTLRTTLVEYADAGARRPQKASRTPLTII